MLSSAERGCAFCALAVWVAGVPTASALAAQAASMQATVATTVGVTRLTAVTVPGGVVTFQIRNRATIPRDFSIGGKRTRQVAPGGSVTLAVALTKGLLRYSSVSSNRSRRITGLLNVLAPCTAPAATTVHVKMAQDHGGVTVSQTAIPCGTVTFLVTNAGTIVDSLKVFADLAEGQRLTPQLRPGETATLTIRFTVKGIAYYESGNYPPGEPELGEYDEGGQFTIK
jgi:hypothetical protein